MPVSRRRNGSWLISFYRDDGTRFRKTLPGELERRAVEAVEARFRVKEGARRDTPRERRGPTVADLTARYWTEHGRHMASAVTERSYLDLWSDTLGDGLPLAEVTMSLLTATVAAWRAGPVPVAGRRRPMRLKPSTINHRLDALRRCWRRAELDWEWALPRINWPRLRADEPEPGDRSLSDEQAMAYLDALPARSRPITLMALHTGLRRGALLRLTREDLDFERGVIRAVSKGRAGGKPTPVPMTQAVLAVLMLMGRLPEVGVLFPVTRDELRNDRERARLAAGLPSLRLHDARHTFAQQLEDAGEGDLITDALHHSTPLLRRRYARARMDRIRERIERAQKR